MNESGLEPVERDGRRPWTPGTWHVLSATINVEADDWENEWSVSVETEEGSHCFPLASIVQDDFAEYNARLIAIAPLMAEALLQAGFIFDEYDFEGEPLIEYLQKAADRVWDIIIDAEGDEEWETE